MKLLPFTCLLALSASAQTLPLLNQAPASLRWQQLNTPHFRVIYPAGFDQQAQRTAARLEQVYEPVSAGLERRPRRLSVVLQNQTTVSNGYATLFPRKSEFFGVPPQDPSLLGTYEWMDLLAVHEFRHVVQYEKALQGYGRVLYTLLGAQGLGFPTQIVTPDWFLEGDAVGTETLLSRSGRGRIPEFELSTRTNLLTRKPFSYAKATGGSFRDNVPNHYELGYFLTTKLKRTYGPDAWSKALNRIYTQFPLYPFSFSNGLKQTTKLPENPRGTRVDDLYTESVSDLVDTWQRRQDSLKLTPATMYPVQAEKANTTRPVFTNYRYPQYLTDSTILCIKSGLGDIPQVVLLSRNGLVPREKRVYTQGLILNDPAYFSATPQKACWIENRYDPRWLLRIWGEINILDLATGTLRRLTTRGRYTAAALSPDNSQLIALRTTDQYQHELVVLDAQTGREVSVLPNPDNDVYVNPRWHNTGTVVTVTLKKTGKTIELMNTQTGQKRALLPVTNSNLSHAQSYGNTHVLFNSPQSGIDNVYAVEIGSGTVSRVTSRPFGAYHAAVSPSGTYLAFQDFNTHGFRIAEARLDPAEWTPATLNAPEQTTRYFGPLLRESLNADAQALPPLTDSVTNVPTNAPTPFRRLAHAFNPYAWGPSFGTDGQTVTLGIQSQDLLATTQLSAGYTYDQSERVGAFAANVSYQGLYPVFDVGFQAGNRRMGAIVSTPGSTTGTTVFDTWQYNQLSAGVRLPLALTQSRFNQSAAFSAYYGLLNISGYDLPTAPFGADRRNGWLNTMSYGAAYSYLLRQNRRDVGTRLGVAISTTLRHTPFATETGEQRGLQWGNTLNLFLPGLGKHHSIRLRGAYQYQWGAPDAKRLYRFGASVLYPRGTPYVAFDETWIGGADYRLPLADLHLSLTRLLYIQRLKGNLFTDYAYGQSNLLRVTTTNIVRGIVPVTSYDWTVGGDLSFVFNPLRLRTPLEVGLRAGYNIRTREAFVQPLVVDIGF